MSVSLPSKRDPEELLRSIDGKALDGLTLILRKTFRPKGREAELRYFELTVKDTDRDPSRDAVIDGLYSSGRPSIALQPYFDISFNYLPRFSRPEGTTDLSENSLDLHLFQTLSGLIEPGGKIIVSVTAPESLNLINETFRDLTAGVPYEATYLGSLLFRCGCGSFFKTWLLREGGREGPPALQGEKALDGDYQFRGLQESVDRLIQFLEGTADSPGLRHARARALSILQEIRIDDKALQQRINDAVAKGHG